MNNPILEGVKDSVKNIENKIIETKELIGFLRDAGENTSTLESELKAAEMKNAKYKRALLTRGIEV